MNVPEGFKEMRSLGEFHDRVGPFFMAKRGENTVIGMRVEARHENGIPTLHGGMMLTLVDTAMTLASFRAAGKGNRAVTVSLASDFLAPARAGDWIEAEVRVLRAGRSLIVLDCLVRKDGPEGKLLLRANGSFQVVAAG